MQILVAATRVEVPRGLEKSENYENRNAYFNFDTKTELGENLSFAISMYMACAMDVRGRVYEVGPLPL